MLQFWMNKWTLGTDSLRSFKKGRGQEICNIYCPPHSSFWNNPPVCPTAAAAGRRKSRGSWHQYGSIQGGRDSRRWGWSEEVRGHRYWNRFCCGPPCKSAGRKEWGRSWLWFSGSHRRIGFSDKQPVLLFSRCLGSPVELTGPRPGTGGLAVLPYRGP